MKKLLGFPFLAFVITFLFIPALSTKFWWVDDGTSILAAQKIVNSLTHFNLDAANIFLERGRFMPVYWFYHTLEYLIGGLNPTIHFFVHYLVILLTALLIYKIVETLSKSKISAFCSGLLYVIAPINTENLYRLGPQEPMLALFIAASIYFLFRNKKIWAIVFLLIVTYTKENGFILWIPILLLYLAKRIFLKKKDKILLEYGTWGIIFSIPIVLNTFLRRTGYSTNYAFNVNQIISNLGQYTRSVAEAFSPILLLLVITFAVRVFIYMRDGTFKKNAVDIFNQAAFLILFIGFVLILSPWKFFLTRYLMPATVGLVIFMGFEISKTSALLNKQKNIFVRSVSLLFMAYLFFFSAVNVYRIYSYGQIFSDTTRFIQSIFVGLAQEVPTNGRVLYNFKSGESTEEYVEETRMQLDFLYGRPDIKVDYLDLNDLPKGKFFVVGTSLVEEGYAREDVERVMDRFRKDEHLSAEKTYSVLTSPSSMVSQVIKKASGFLLRRTPFSSEGIVAYYYAKDYWYSYYPKD